MSLLPIQDFPHAARLASFPEPEGLYAAFRAYEEEPPTLEAARQAMYGDQKAYEVLKAMTVGWACKELESHRTKENNEAFFTSIVQMIRQLGELRQEIAQPNTEFGVWRTEKDSLITPLVRRQYRSANQKLRSVFASCVPRFGHTKKDKGSPESYTFEDKFSRFTISRYTQKDCRDLYNLVFAARCVQGGFTEQNREHLDLLDTMNAIGREISSDLKLPGLETEASTFIQDGKSGLQFFVARTFNRVGKEWVPLTGYITWIKQKKTGPVTDEAMDYFQQYGYVTYVHTDVKQFDPLLRSIANISHRLIQLNPDEKKFRADLSVLDYRLFHAMLFKRGSEAIAEIFVTAICVLQNMRVPIANGEDALTQPFLAQYMNDPKRYTVDKGSEQKRE